MSKQEITYLSLGSNLGTKLYNLQNAIFLIQEKVGTIINISNVYQSPSWGFNSDDFLNICISISSNLTSQDLLTSVLKIENELGRERSDTAGYSSRPIDIDILYYGDNIINTETLTVPHPHIADRKFVLKPLADIAPQFYHPIHKKDTRNLLQECTDDSVLTITKSSLFKDKKALFSKLQFITIEGNIGAGKTTLANKIANDFNAKLILERFADNPFLPKFYEDQNRYAFPLEMSFLADRYQQFIDDTSQLDLFKNFMVSDYDFYKSLIFAKITLPKEEFNLYRKVFNFMHKEVTKPTLYIYLHQNTERLLENIKKRGRDYEQNITPEYLDKINRGYLDYIKSYPEQNNLIIDVSHIDFVNKKEDYEYILEKIQEFAIQRIF